MTPKEKAIWLVNKFSHLEDGEMYIGKAKQCALIAVDEIIESRPSLPELLNGGYLSEEILLSNWQEVKQEIEKL